MREPPEDVEPADVLAAVRHQWDEAVDDIVHLPVGFGAHHWQASTGGRPSLLVTFDRPFPGRDGATLERAYAAAAALADAGLGFVLATLPARSGRRTVPFGDGSLSVTRWHEPVTATPEGEDITGALLGRLHTVAVPDGLPEWCPLPQPLGIPGRLAAMTAEPWRSGPYGDRARAAVRGRLPRIRQWSVRYDELVRVAITQRDRWVVTHGEPDTSNQLHTKERTFLVDWESVRRAPRERDLRGLVRRHGWQHGYAGPVDERMVELFDLDWQLGEIVAFSAWFAAPHSGTDSDRVAFGGLLDELAGEPGRLAGPPPPDQT
jgi:spectinomycin phosphotransferase